MKICLQCDIPADVLRGVLAAYGVDVPEGADVVAAWNRAVADRRAGAA